MMIGKIGCVVLVTVLALGALGTAAGSLKAQVDYSRAERFLTWNTSRMISGDEVEPEWMEDGRRFWYRNKTGSGYQFVVVNGATGARDALFNHYRLAAAMSMANDTSYESSKLPFSTFEFASNETTITFNASKRLFECNVVNYSCIVGDTLASDVPFVESPDGRWEAFVHEYNLWVRPTGGGDSVQLTTDGEEFYRYGEGTPRPSQIRAERPSTPDVVWSPDSRRVAVARQDERDVGHMHYISYTSQRPKHYSYPYALPGDSAIPHPTFHIVNITRDIAAARDRDASGPNVDGIEQDGFANLRFAGEPRPHQLSIDGSQPDSSWSADSRRLYYTYFTRGAKSVHLAVADANTGSSRVLVSDSSKTFVETSQRGPASWHVTEDENDVIWWSERDGWAHLYRFDGNGRLKNQITSGSWTVGTVHFVDEVNRQIYFTGRGREPGRNLYYAHLYRVNFDGSGMQLLTPEDADHTIRFSPRGDTFVDTYSRVETAPVTVVRAAGGRLISEIERADVTRLQEIDWEPAEVFTVKARDGLTDLYGVMYLPPNLDPAAKYPIITHIYPGPQVGSVGTWRFKGGGEDFALAQLGFVVIQLDHLGTPHRSKSFHDNYYGNFTDNGLPDHVSAIRQLAARHQFIDLDRIGIYGHSGGGFATADAMFRYPEFFKVGVSGAGNHDNRSYNIYWAEKYQGELVKDSTTNEDNFAASANKTYAENLRGHLLLMHGDMDDNVHPANTIQVVDELIKANKDFDLIIAPDRAHGLDEPYFIRRRWDYFVRHLLGQEPPKEYEIVRPEN